MKEKLYSKKCEINKIHHIKNFAVYYGMGKENELSKYDLVIVEPLGQNENTINFLKQNNTIVIAYVSFLEVHKMCPGYDLLKKEDFLMKNENYVINQEYNTRLVDLSSKRWASILIHHIGNLHKNLMYDGIFIDTLGDIEYFSLSSETKALLINAALQILNEIKILFPNLIIVQNNGLKYIYLVTGNYIDGICLENPVLLKEKNKLEHTKDKLYDLKQSGITVFLLSNEKSLINYDKKIILNSLENMAVENNFLYYNSVYGYEIM